MPGGQVLTRRGAEPRVGTVSVRGIGGLLDIGVTAGVSRDVLMDAVGVSDADLHDPDARLPLAADIAAWQAFAKQISDPGFGVRAGAVAQRPRSALMLVSYSRAIVRQEWLVDFFVIVDVLAGRQTGRPI